MTRAPLEKPLQPVPLLDLKGEVDALEGELNAAFQRVMRSGQFILGPEVEALEREVATYLGASHAVGVNSGTDALVIALRALGVGPGDEVITTPFSFFATAESVCQVGATPIFCDVDPDSFNLDPARVEAKIGPRTKALLPVHLYGRPAEMAALNLLAERHGLVILEDGAQAFGATYHPPEDTDDSSELGTCELRAWARRLHGKRTGTLGHMSAFSFFPSKNLGAYGDGGMIVTDNAQLAEAARMLRNHGAKRKYHNEWLGYNSRLDSLQAALLRVKLPHVEAWNEGRRHVATRYNELLEPLAGVITPEVTPGHVFHQYTVRLPSADRDAVQRALAEQGVASAVYYPVPQDRLPALRDYRPDDEDGCPQSNALTREVLSLPIWSTLSQRHPSARRSRAHPRAARPRRTHWALGGLS